MTLTIANVTAPEARGHSEHAADMAVSGGTAGTRGLAAALAAGRTPWVHRWAQLTVVVTAIALFTGARVTTLRVGMADPVWPTAPWYLASNSWAQMSSGFLIEHTHRFADYCVGLCIIVLMLGLWRSSPQRRWLGILALTGVIFQGLLGGFRVKLNELAGTDLAFLHGSFAQLVFGLLIGIAVITSPRWSSSTGVGGRTPSSLDSVPALSRWLVALVYVQLVLGGLVRHKNLPTAGAIHMLVAFSVVALVAWMLGLLWEQPRGWNVIGRPVAILAVLVGLQVGLGIEAWMSKFASGTLPELHQLTPHEAMIRTLHFVVGSLVFGTAIVVALRAYHATDSAESGRAASTEPVGGAA